MRDYLQHGRRHAVTGSDPIPGLDGTSMIVAKGNAASVSPTGTTYLDFTDYLTSDPGAYSLELGTGGLSSKHGIAIHQNGVYRAWFRYVFQLATDGDLLEGSYDGGAGPNIGWTMTNSQQEDETVVTYQSGPPARINNTNVQFARLFVIGGSLEPLPVASLPRLVFARTSNETAGGGGSTYNVQVWVLVEKLGSSYTTNASTIF